MMAWQRVRFWLTKPFVLFSLLMILKMYLAGYVIFEGWRLWPPLATGLPSVWVVFCLIELLAPRRKLGLYLTANGVLTSVYFAVIMYYKYFGVIVTYHALQQVNQVTEVKGSVFSLLHPYFLLIYTDFVVLLLLLCVSKAFRAWGRGLKIRERRSVLSVIGVLSLAACIFTVWPYRHSMNEVVQAEKMGIINYEVYAAFAPSKDEQVDVSGITQAQIDQLKGYVPPSGTPLYWGKASGKNVLVVQMEALQNFLVGKSVDGQVITPNLNALVGESLYFDRFYQQVGQGNTADAEFVVNTSMFVPSHGAASQEYADKELPGMPRLFGANGYDTATFHTNDAVFWNRTALYPALGWQTYYDKKLFGDEDTVMFGASDEVLYAKSTAKLAEMAASGKPFYAQLISMSGHHPYKIPSRKYKMELPERFKGTLVGDYIRAQNYADFALGELISDLKARGLWDDTTVVLYGDHQGLPIYSLTSGEKKLMKEMLGRDYELTDMLNIPLLIKLPAGAAEHRTIGTLGGQSDIFPTVANLAGLSMSDHLHFGQDLLNSTGNMLPERYYLPTGSFIDDSGMFISGTGFEDGRTLGFKDGGETPGGNSRTNYDNAMKLLSMSDGYVRSLPERK